MNLNPLLKSTWCPALRFRRSNTIVRLASPILISVALNMAEAATPAETFTQTLEMSFSNADMNVAEWSSPVWTHSSGNIYFAWVDPNRRTMIAKKTPGGTVTTAVISSTTDNDIYHTTPSVAVDKNGYIHVVYNMHNSPLDKPVGTAAWQYKVSDLPESIAAFTFVGDTVRSIPGDTITYPFFAMDNSQELYISFRHRADGGWDPGDLAAGLAKYDASSQRWAMLGGTNYTHGVKTFAWSPMGKLSTAYQGYRTRVFFDSANRMHLTWTVHNNSDTTSTTATWVMYAYSDDGGITFKKASGAAITSLPIQTSNGDIVAQQGDSFYSISWVGRRTDGKPIVAYRNKATGVAYLSTWNGTSWAASTNFPSGPPCARMTTDSNGIITAVESNILNRSFDNGGTWQSYSIPTGIVQSANFDYTYFKETNQLRMQRNLGGTVEVWTIRFSGTQPPGGSVPNAPSNLTATAASASQINLAWADNSNNETGFKVERKTGAGTFSQIATPGVNATTYNNTGLSAGTTYTYRVRGTNTNGDSAYSNQASATTLPPPASTVRIETGNTASFTDSLGNVWSADQNFTGGTALDRGSIAIANTVEDRIYQTERYGMTAYAIPVANGAYTVKLHFAETASSITGAGQRIFTVKAEGVTPSGWANIDVFAQAGGKNRALIKTATVTVGDGTLNLTFTASVNNAEINGIEVIPQ